MAAKSPMQMSLAHLRSLGYLCVPVEHWNHHAGVRQDLFGFCDVLCVPLSGKGGFLFVQTTSYKNIAARVAKVKGSHEAAMVLHAGGRIVVHGWGRNQFREVEVTL